MIFDILVVWEEGGRERSTITQIQASTSADAYQELTKTWPSKVIKMRIVGTNA